MIWLNTAMACTLDRPLFIKVIHLFSCVSLAGESCSCLGIVWRQTETHRQEQCSSQRRPTHPDGGRPWTGEESDVTGNTECTLNT